MYKIHYNKTRFTIIVAYRLQINSHWSQAKKKYYHDKLKQRAQGYNVNSIIKRDDFNGNAPVVNEE